MFKHKTKKLLSVVIAMVMLVSALSVSTFANAATSTVICAINETTFPDANFRTVVKDWYDDNSDGYLDSSEVSGVTFISVAGMLEDSCGEDAQITDLTGINYFTNCKRLRCSGLGITKLPVDELTNLLELTCQGNELDTIDVSNNTLLQTLNCASNNLKTIDVSYNTQLARLDCYANQLTSVNFCSNAGSYLTRLQIQQNEFDSLDVSALTSLAEFNCSYNHLTSLDLSKNTALTDVTQAYIGNQTVSSVARLNGDNIYVGFDVPNYSTNLVSSSADTTSVVDDEQVVTSAYDGADFAVPSIDNLIDNDNEIVYYYNTGLDIAENMDVHIAVSRDFYQVRFYTASDMQTELSTTIVNVNNAATAPEITDTPLCKKFDGWSEDFSSVTTDLNVYALWADDHNIVIQSFSNGVVNVNCTKCMDMEKNYTFSNMVNAKSDDDDYAAIIDRNSDGIINAKDYAMLLRNK